jgi:hypothetical protein
MNWRMAVRGADKIKAAMKQSIGTVNEAIGAAIYEEAQDIISKSVPLVPVDSGRLRASHYVAPPKDSSKGPTVEMGYGTTYAIPVHERTDVRHVTGQAKYLEQPVAAAKSGYASRIAERTRKNLRSGAGHYAFGGPAPKSSKAGAR